MKTGMLAAETIMEEIGISGNIESLEGKNLDKFEGHIKNSWVPGGLKKSRNF